MKTFSYLMTRYPRIEECYGTAQQNQELLIGYSSVHMTDPHHNWINGFSNMNDDLVYVPDGTKLIGPDNIEYQLILLKDEKSGESSALLRGKEKRFGLDTKIEISLEEAMTLRFNSDKRKRLVFKVKELSKISSVAA